MVRNLQPLPIEPATNYAPLTRAEREQALCAQADPEEWFPGKGGSTRQAKRICGTCDIQARCLSAALGYPDEQDGVWGGTSVRQRRPFWQAVQKELTGVEPDAGDTEEVAA